MKLRRTQAEYLASRSTMTALALGARRYVCRRCQANFNKGEGKPDATAGGLGKCNLCISQLTKPSLDAGANG